MTVHNLAFQGQFSPELLASLGLPASSFTIHGVEYYGGIGFLKAGLKLADRITTVSPTYALEIQTDEGGMGLGGLFRSRAGVLSGILNGLDDAVWNPAKDSFCPRPFSRQDLGPRAKNKAELRARFGLAPESKGPLFGVVSRLTWQKGFDLLLGALPVLLEEGRAARAAGLRRGRGWRAASATPPIRIPAASAITSAMTRASPIWSRAGSMRCWCPRARSPAASPSSARCAMGRCPWSRGWAGSPIR